KLPNVAWKSSRTAHEVPASASPQTGLLALRIKLLGGNSQAHAIPQGELSTKSHYFAGAEPAKWRTGIPNYSSIRYQNVYPSIDVVYYGSQQQLEYDFVIAPGGNPNDIRLSFEDGNDSLGSLLVEIDSTGDVLLHTRAGVTVQKRALSYQEIDGG